MKTLFYVLGICAILLSPMAMAQSNKPLIVGGTAGFMKPHGSDNDSGFSIGATLGQRIQGNFEWEADMMLQISDGSIGNTNDYSINSIAGYGVYRTDGDVHFKVKAGVAYWDDNFDNDTNLSTGVGIGIKLGRALLDVEYTQINDYVDYITVGYKVPF